MNMLSRIFTRRDDRAFVRPLYSAVVAHARQPHWYVAGGVADTIDGRFDMVSAVLALVLVRMENLGGEAAAASSILTEAFVEDMDGQLREMGIGDVIVGKHIGKMMSALGGRLGAYRASLSGAGGFADALMRNLYRDVAPAPAALAHVERELTALNATLQTRDYAALLRGEISR